MNYVTSQPTFNYTNYIQRQTLTQQQYQQLPVNHYHINFQNATINGTVNRNTSSSSSSSEK